MKSIPLISEIPKNQLASLKALFFDIDDTFSSHGFIGGQAFTKLWDLAQRTDIALIPVTGRPAGWCDFIARMWPVTAVVGENGAFYQLMTPVRKSFGAVARGGAASLTPSRLKKNYLESPLVRKKNEILKFKLKKKLLKKFSGLKFASDQAFREFDLAIDYCEDVRPWKKGKVQQLLTFCEEQGAQAKLSSIHVNTWYGRYDKLTCVHKLSREILGLNLDLQKDQAQVAYVGDSPNDEPFFKHLPFTVGVANVSQFISLMEHHPAFLTQSEAGEGFSEFAGMIIQAKMEKRESRKITRSAENRKFL